ncbi:MAG: recombinase family protein [Eubacteriales bacterium]
MNDSSDIIGMYLRVSNDDELAGESLSIQGQRNLICNYIDTHKELNQYKRIEVIDDGFTGTNFERPGIKRLLELVKKGEVSCIIVKDLSRFGRNYIEVGNYLERIFPLLGIRFISVNDNYDSEKQKNEMLDFSIPFKNLLHDLYSKDISRKILSSKKMKAEKGEFFSKYGFYGYKKDATNRNKLVIDVEAAEVIKKIYMYYIEGNTTGKIARLLNANNVPTISQHKMNCGIWRKDFDKRTKTTWESSMIKRILNDERYTGKYIAGTIECRIENNKKVIKKPKDEWIVLDGVIPAIISQEVYDEVRNIKANKQNVKHGKYNDTTAKIFVKKIRCKSCGRYMARKGDAKKLFRCGYSYYSDGDCFTGNIKEQDIVDQLLVIFNHHISLTCELKKEIAKRYTETEKIISEKKNALKVLSDKLKKSEMQDLRLYEMYKTKKITKDEFLLMKKKENELRSRWKVDYEYTARELCSLESINTEDSMIVDKLNTDSLVQSIDKDIVDRLINVIWVDKDGNLEFEFNYKDPTDLIGAIKRNDYP